MEHSIPICGLRLVLHLANTQAVPAVFTQVLAEDSHTVFPLWVPVWMLLFSWALVQLPQGEAFGHFSQRKQIFVVRIVKFHLQSTGVNFHTFATVRGNAQCLHGNVIISNSKIPSFQEGSELEPEPFTFITKYCCGVSLVWEVSLFLAYCISDLKNQKKKNHIQIGIWKHWKHSEFKRTKKGRGFSAVLWYSQFSVPELWCTMQTHQWGAGQNFLEG